MASPASEMTDGFKRAFRTDGSGAADGVKLSMEYPCSWLPDSGQWTEGIIQMFTSEDGRGLSSLSLGVASLPPEISREIAKAGGVSNAVLNRFANQRPQDYLGNFGNKLAFAILKHWIPGSPPSDRIPRSGRNTPLK